MSEKFTASNGQTVAIVDGDLMVGNPPLALSPVGVAAMREFFLHERDQELGRWRSKEFPEYVVYSKEASEVAPEPGVRVVHEVSGRSRDIGREVVGACDATVSRFGKAAQAYFDAHPLPKPAWHDAKPGEVWVLTDSEDTKPAFVTDGGRFELEIGYCDLDCEDIIDAKRVWPEAVES